MIVIHTMWFMQSSAKRMLKFGLADHWGYVRNQTLDKATGEHFSLPGHSLSYLTITLIEQSKINNNLYRQEG